MPNCRLQTLERCLFGRYRTEDIPSNEIPQAYHDFVRTGDAHLLPNVLYHNRMDMLTMAELVCALLTGVDPISE